MEGDWITTQAGARYLVLSAKMGTLRRHAQQTRWSMSCLRLERDLQVPEGVHAIELRWYKR